MQKLMRMTHLLDQLHQDHIYTEQLLNGLARLLEGVNHWTMSDFDLMLDMVEYLTQYSDDLHHPRENLVYFKLSKVCENLGHEMMSVVEEHDEIAAHGREIRDCLMSVRAGAIVLQDTICNEITHYIDTLRDHMGLEETRLFPLARESLGPDDWAEIDSTMAARTDPLFGAESESRYERVRRFLEQEMSAADNTE